MADRVNDLIEDAEAHARRAAVLWCRDHQHLEPSVTVRSLYLAGLLNLLVDVLATVPVDIAEGWLTCVRAGSADQRRKSAHRPM